MDCNGRNLYELISDAEQILLYKTKKVRTTPITGQQLIQDLIDEDVALYQRCDYGCFEHFQQLQQQREMMQEAGSNSKGDAAAAAPEKSGSNEEAKSTSEDTKAEGAQCEPAKMINDNETDTGTVNEADPNVLQLKVSQASGGNQDGQ